MADPAARLGWTRQRPARRAAERDDAAIEAWVKQDWPRITRGHDGAAPGSASSCAVRRCDSGGGERPSPPAPS
ncbi:winged helix-turn-helix domain-containing protein [Dactylosporangium sp. NPDC000521]|uniref:winged helix-turn-helix domain-containing protein n=1 Tax=Dactylosporangium sp. NPDC000521 TaxID=3363975 RepID=UPI003673798F